MKIDKTIAFVLAASLSIGTFAQETVPQVKVGGFIRNYFAYDSRENVSGTEDLFNYLPKDENIVDGKDLNQVNSFRFAALTSRLWVQASGYQVEGWDVSARIEGDFYSGVTGVTGTAQLRLRQAFVTLGKNAWNFKVGQAWHPMAADMPDIFSLNAGAPFGPFNRSPLALAEVKLSDAFTLSAAAIWQMQYASNGPSGTSANYIKWGCTPEFYFGLNYKSDAFLGRAGVDILSIKPRRYNDSNTAKVNDRITTVSPFLYAQYSKDLLTIKAKTVFAQAGEHFNLNGGYGVSAIHADGTWDYTPTRNSSSWLSILYGKKLQGMLFAGYVKNFGTKDSIIDTDHLYFSKNSFKDMTQMWRLTPTVLYNLGKVAFGLEYEVTGVEYGDFAASSDSHGLATENLHWVVNNRLQMMLKYTF